MVWLVSVFSYSLVHHSGDNISFSRILYDDIIFNWNVGFIEDIRTDINPCSLEKGYEPFSTTLWGGIIEGCDCITGKGVEKQDLLARSCTQVELSRDWRGIAPIPKKSLNIYRGHTICMKRSELNFFNVIRPKINGEWPQNYKPCGGDATPPSKIYWVEEKQQCLINSIKIAKSGNFGPNYTSRDLEEGWQISFSRKEPNSLPIVDRMLTEGYPCINPHEFDMTKGRYIYPLTRLINNSTYKYHGWQDSINNEIFKSPGFEKLDQIDEEKLFKDNGIYLELQNLPLNQMEYTSPSYFYGLYTRPVIDLELSWEYSNLGMSRQEIKEREHDFVQIENWHKFLNRACLFYISAVLILFIPFFFMIIATLFSNNNTLLSLIKPWNAFSNILIILISLVIIAISFTWMYFNWNLSEFIFLIVKHECSSKQILHIWVHLYETLLFSNQLKFFVIGSTVISIVIQIFFLKYFWNIDKEEKEVPLNNSNQNRLTHSQLRED